MSSLGTYLRTSVVLLSSLALSLSLAMGQSVPGEVPDLPDTTPPSTVPTDPTPETPTDTSSNPDTPPDDTPDDPPDGVPDDVVMAPSIDSALLPLLIKAPMLSVQASRYMPRGSFASRAKGMIAIKLESGTSIEPDALMRKAVGAGIALLAKEVGTADGHTIVRLLGPTANRSRAWQDRLISQLAALPEVSTASPVFARGGELRIPTKGIWVRFADGTSDTVIASVRASVAALGTPISGSNGMLYFPATYADGRDLLRATALIASQASVESVFPHQVRVSRTAN